MNFASPGYLALLALAPLLAMAHLALDRWRRGATRRFAPGQEAIVLVPSVSPRRRALKAAFVVLAVGALAVALARPRLGEQETVVYQAGADVVIALDVSRSMLADDAKPDRLALAQRETLALLDRLRGHRVGMVIFARTALVRSPLTTDLEPLRALVRSARQDSSLLAPGSDLGAALRLAVSALEAGEGESKAIVLITDGEDHEGGALAAAREAAGERIVLYTVGAGTEGGAPVPARDAEANARPLAADEGPITRRDEGLLRRMAAVSARGRYLPAERLATLAGAIEGLESTPFAADRQQRPIERFQWAVLAALALLAAEALLSERRGAGRPWLRLPRGAPRAGGAAALLVLALVGASCTSSASSLLAEGNRAFERGDYLEALEAYRRAAASEPDRTEAHLNAGLTLHRLGRYEEAATETARALTVDDPRLAARARYNLGNHYAVLGRLAEAADWYREALLLEPDDADAKHNLELVLRLMEASSPRLVEQPTEPDGGGSGADAGPSGQPAPDGAPAGEGAGGGDLEGSGGAAQRDLAEALAGVERKLTVEEALRVLELAQELNRQRPLTEGERASDAADHPDY